MRVAIDVSAIPAQPAGAGIYVLRVVEALDRLAALQLELVARKDDGARWADLAPSAEVRTVAPSARPVRLAWEQVAGPALAREADVWHGPHYTMPLLAWTPRVVTIHDLTFFDHPEWHETKKISFFRRMIRAAARWADVLVCVSDHTARRLHEVLDPQAPVVVASHGVDHERFRPAAGAPSPVAGRYVAFVGTIEPRKDVPGLVRAVSRLDDDVKLVLAGRPGWGTEAVDAAIAETGMAERIVRLGYVDDAVVPALLHHAAAVAYPAFEEGFGLPALEALACGAALVTTTGSAMADVVEDAAVLVPPGDTDALTDALRSVVDGDADALRRRGPEVAAAHTWARSAERHVEAYRLASGG